MSFSHKPPSRKASSLVAEVYSQQGNMLHCNVFLERPGPKRLRVGYLVLLSDIFLQEVKTILTGKPITLTYRDDLVSTSGKSSRKFGPQKIGNTDQKRIFKKSRR